MPDNVPMSQAAITSLVTTLQNTDLFALAREDNTSETGYRSKVARVDAMAKKVVSENTYSDLQTTNKSIIGAINEVASGAYIEITGTLTAGQTSITLNDASITSSSFIQVFAGNGNINYTSISVTTGSVTIGFLAQASDMTVTVRVS